MWVALLQSLKDDGKFGHGTSVGQATAVALSFDRENYCRVGAILDGTSNTIAMSECVVTTAAGNNTIHGNYVELGCGNWSLWSPPYSAGCLAKKGPGNTIIGTPGGNRGTHYGSGWYSVTGFDTILPPNSIGCYSRNTGSVLPPDSNHPGGVNGLMADGSVRFISENIQAGNPNNPTVTSGPSLFGVWGAMGSKAGGDMVGAN